MSLISIATWNLERPSSAPLPRTRRILAAIQRAAADIWVLTETRETLIPGPEYCAVHSKPHPGRRPDDERWVSIWSRWPAISLWQDAWSATARVDTPGGDVLVHGVVLPYMNEPGRDGKRVLGWSRFREELSRQRHHWRRLREQHPTIPLVVAGDFNQNLDGRRWYGSQRTRQALCEALDHAELNCLTLEDVVAAHKLERNHLIDHICVTDGLAVHEGIWCWEPTIDGLRMSDHPGVALRLSRGPVVLAGNC
jgi:hypothetical protein